MQHSVLVVDDHPAVALALKLHFKRDGEFAVAGSAPTAAEGLRLLADVKFAAVLLDLHLDDLEGEPLVRAFRAATPDTPLILHSAAGDTPEVDAVRGLVDAVALKSDVREVLSALRRLTAG
jgi:DNA-binding NarL/FixJ family response regulator